MDEQNSQKENQKQEELQPAKKYIRLKPFTLIMLIIVLIVGTSGITILALTFGEKKVVQVRTNTHPQFQKLFDVYDELSTKYYKELDEDQMVQGAMTGMMGALDDPYSTYMPKAEADEFNDQISSSFEGIGAEIQEKDGQIVVVSPIKNSPAEKAGLKPNDIVKTVDGKSIVGKTANEAVKLIRGEKGTDVTIEFQRGSSKTLHKLTLTRAEIPVETVYASMNKQKIAHIQITSFSDNTYKELLEKLDEMESKGMKGLVLDVRQNPGGRLDIAINIASLFVKTGETVVQVENRDGEKEVANAQDGRKVTVPTTVLIDSGSASASEILAAAMSESSNVKLVGEKSFGKGTVQTVEDLSDGATLKYTMAKWLTPDGNWIHEKGIQPNVKVKYPSYASLPYLDTSKTFKQDDISDSVKVAEKMLDALGYDVGKIDGLYDYQMTTAVQKFQADHDLEVTGVLKGNTTTEIMTQLRNKIKKEDPQLKKAQSIVEAQIK
ncbi:S41 family peptidase [Kurthia senegalensis]|uniref:lmo1851 family serine protease n=1 Tax=Kurthia senegalensis TaxID=1033740 RepID=UPI000287E457